jgi:hypothetical protein
MRTAVELRQDSVSVWHNPTHSPQPLAKRHAPNARQLIVNLNGEQRLKERENNTLTNKIKVLKAIWVPPHSALCMYHQSTVT